MRLSKKISRLTVLALAAMTVVMVARALYLPAALSLPENSSSIPLPKLNEEAVLAVYSKLLTFKTISNDSGLLNDAEFNSLQLYLKKTYPQIFSHLSLTMIGKHAMLLKWQGSEDKLQPVLFLAHQDTVPITPGTELAWQQPPFSGAIAEGYVWGRGAIDTKSTLSGLLTTLAMLIDENFTPKRTVYFYFGDDEEIGGASAKLASDLLKQKNIHFEYVIDEGSIIAKNMFLDMQSTIATIGVAEKGNLNLQLTTHAEGGHSSIPPNHSAIGDLSEAITKLVKHPFPAHIRGVTREMLENLSSQMPFYKRIVLANSWFFSPIITRQLCKSAALCAMTRTTQAPTIFNAGSKSNVLPAQASAVINYRLDLNDTIDSVVARVRKVVNNPAIDITVLKGWNPSPASTTNGPGYILLYSAIHNIFGNNTLVTPFILTGATDARHFVAIADNVYRFTPLIMSEKDFPRVHGTNERYAAQDYLKLVHFYYVLLRNQ